MFVTFALRRQQLVPALASIVMRFMVNDQDHTGRDRDALCFSTTAKRPIAAIHCATASTVTQYLSGRDHIHYVKIYHGHI